MLKQIPIWSFRKSVSNWVGTALHLETTGEHQVKQTAGFSWQ